MNIDKDILEIENSALHKENQRLQDELYFMNLIFENKHSNVSNLMIKTRNGLKIWIDQVLTPLNVLLTLDPDEEINKLIRDKTLTRYSDKY